MRSLRYGQWPWLICIALVIFASWHPGKALFGAILFGAFDALQVRLQAEMGPLYQAKFS